MPAPVFISHSSQDRGTAETLCAALEQRGLACWISSRDIGPGQNFQEAIVRAVGEARVMVLVFSSAANGSDEIKKELALASQNRLPVVPARVEDVVPTDAFKYELATRQWIDIFADWERAVGKLADHIREIVGGAELAPPPPAPAPIAAKKPASRVWIAVAAAVIVAAVGCFRLLQSQGTSMAAPKTETPAPATAQVGGRWASGTLTNPYATNEKYTLRFEFEQSGDSLLGTVTEAAFGNRGDTRGIQEGKIAGNAISFYTTGVTTDGASTHPYKVTYHGTVEADRINLIRQTDVSSGGLPEKFSITRQ